jgi:hypothetical protein
VQEMPYVTGKPFFRVPEHKKMPLDKTAYNGIYYSAPTNRTIYIKFNHNTANEVCQ